MNKLGWVVALGALVLGLGGRVEVARGQLAHAARPLHGYAHLDQGFGPDPQVLQGTGGGRVAASSFGPTCRGFVNAQPNHVIRSRTGFRLLRLVVDAPGDPTLVVMLPNGIVLCDDDGGEGLNPLIELSSLPGDIRVWVGAYSQHESGRPYTLGLTEYAHVSARHLAAPPTPVQVQATATPTVTPTAAPEHGTVHLRRGFMPDPQLASGQAGGAVAARSMDRACRGHISPRPSHVVMSQSGFGRLRIVVNSGSLDSTLVVMAPNGQLYCDDDSGGAGLNPMVEVATGPGPIRVWVGSYHSNRRGPYTIGFTELGHVTAANLPPPTHAQPAIVAQPTAHPIARPAIVAQPIAQPTAQPIAQPVAQPVAQPSAQPAMATQVVPMQEDIPVTLLGPGLEPGTVAMWQPEGGAATPITVRGRSLIAGDAQLTRFPPSMREPVVTVMQQRRGYVVVRMEQAPTGSRGRGEAIILRVAWRGQPVIEERWEGRFGQRGPRWAR